MSKEDQIKRLKTTGRNDPCPCGSGKKYKKCHLFEDEAAQHEMMKKTADEREAALKAEAEAEKDGDESGKKSDAAGSRKSGEPGFNQKDTHTHNAQNRPSNLPRRGAI